MKVTDEAILEIIADNPGATITTVHRELQKKSRAAKIFGVGSFWTELFGPSFGGLIVKMWRLEDAGRIVSAWGELAPGRLHRPRNYFIGPVRG